ncbi:DNA-3-methyladenine glycosylase family protein [Georgenia ruanii]|uniref:DNA-3-methyladenine glycosylase II n=1 Tax=Georgenia ruanii TaxID=348442 RepID=A0A7J9UWZ7_9MICO|nr:AlkA N-terminal domain-containing protein [Georgenia ruanii]MPV88224.1 3-methyladenine DNA glycosylase 2 [Georgenia ruanii]
MSVRIALHPPFAVAPVLAALAAHAVPGVERAEPEAARHTRTVPAPHGPAVVTVRLADDHVAATVHAHPGDEAEVVALVRRWLDLEVDPAAVADVLGADPLLGPLVAARPGLRVLGHVDGFEAAAVTVLGQQVSLAAARTFAGRLVAAHGGAAPLGLRAFPRPAVIAGAAPEELRAAVGITRARARTLIALAEACADGLDLRPGQDPASVRRRLLALPGIGPWTADYLALRALGDRDAFPATDLVLRRALGNPAPAAALAQAEPWRPLRAYAVTHLWTAHAYV